MPTVYLAGPDVFLPDARQVGSEKVLRCRRQGLTGLFPLDKELENPADPFEIFHGNVRLMDRADAGLFNLSPFQGAGADQGTVFELGYMHAKGKPCFAYSADPRELVDRVGHMLGPLTVRAGLTEDINGHMVEDFGLTDNLMLAGAARPYGGIFVADADRTEGLEALAAFDLALAAVSAFLK